MNRKLWKVLSLALALPASIMAISYLAFTLVDKKIINIYAGAALIVLYITSLLVMMVKSANTKSN